MLTIMSINNYLQSTTKAPCDLKEGNVIPTITIQWDKAAELVWTLRLAEFFGDASQEWGYQPKIMWQDDGKDGMFYKNCPPSNREDIRGKCSAHIHLKGDSLRFELTLKNDSDQVWSHCWGWLCLIHRWARTFQANCELPTGSSDKPWVSIASLPAPIERWLKWCGIRGKEDVVMKIGRIGGTRWQPHIWAQEGKVRAWCVKGNKQQYIELESSNAVILGWSHWPCTDMGVYFGTLNPGQTGAVSGTLCFFEKSFIPI